MCKRITHLLFVFVMIAFLSVPAMAQGGNPDKPVPLSEVLDNLVDMIWHPGTFETPMISFDYHYRLHCNNRGIETNNPSEYFELAMEMYHDTMANPEQYRILEQRAKGSDELVYKYTHQESKLFIIHNQKYNIYSFGGQHIRTEKKQKKHQSAQASFVVTEENLALLGWHLGNHSSLVESFMHHYGYHRTDRGIDGREPEAYLKLAVTTRTDTQENPKDYKVNQRPPRPGEEPTCKYTHRDTGVYIIIGQESKMIYSCGGRHTQDKHRGPGGTGRIRTQRSCR